MARKQDPIIAVMAFFEEASLETAQSALALAKALVRKRTPLVEKSTRRRRGPKVKLTRVEAVDPIASSPSVQPIAPPAPANGTTRRRQRAVATRAVREDRSLPGLPGLGPSTVGE